MGSIALRAVLLVGAAAVGAAKVAAQQVAAPPFEAGKHYAVLTPAQPTSTGAGKVEVTEIFMFGCPGCFGFEPYIQAWLEKKADYINFVRVPAQWSSHPESPMHARAYYTAEVLGKLGEFEEDFFHEVAFKSTFNSSAVNAKLKRADELVQRYRVQSTPTVIVNGKYQTVGRMAGSVEAWFAIIDDLAAREHATGSAASAR
jgi:thiol:disulfide interchange protein DsbA